MPSSNHITAISLGELVAPVLPESFFLNEDNANERLRKCVIFYMDNETIVNRGKTKEQFITMYNSLPADSQDDDWDEIDVSVSAETLVASHGDDFVSFLLTSSNNEQHLSAVDLFTTMFIAVAKRGNVTDEFLAKISQGLQDDLQHQAKHEPEVQ